MSTKTTGRKTMILGPEYHRPTREALRAVLEELGASTAQREWGIGGSQEVETIVAKVGKEEVTIESETYVGLTVSGAEELVITIAERVAKRLKGTSSPPTRA
jgi:hypothetical protein